jgi:hypothetical protein
MMGIRWSVQVEGVLFFFRNSDLLLALQIMHARWEASKIDALVVDLAYDVEEKKLGNRVDSAQAPRPEHYL